MQAQKLAPPDMICKDKFLVQCTVVRARTTDEDINSSMVSYSVIYKVFGPDYLYWFLMVGFGSLPKIMADTLKRTSLRVILISPPNSPILSPINGTLKQVPPYEASILKDQDTNDEESKMEKSEVVKPAKNVEYKTTKEVGVPAKTVEYTTTKDVEEPAKTVENDTTKEVKEPVKTVEYTTMKDEKEPAKIVEYETMKDVEDPAKDLEYETTKEVEEPAKTVKYTTMKDVEGANKRYRV
ncbi:hypothetical protein Acr_08g0003930 [Actinidia rufa]|uniref:Uncharacterized protein n=1 Tax=Actinidia rufa TaxID=165716 RepID=A0A7J0F272_9ERIC|nr:hypothetical protein Acr_08g0003930 [Actinidia rufa]